MRNLSAVLIGLIVLTVAIACGDVVEPARPTSSTAEAEENVANEVGPPSSATIVTREVWEEKPVSVSGYGASEEILFERMGHPRVLDVIGVSVSATKNSSVESVEVLYRNFEKEGFREATSTFGFLSSGASALSEEELERSIRDEMLRGVLNAAWGYRDVMDRSTEYELIHYGGNYYTDQLGVGDRFVVFPAMLRGDNAPSLLEYPMGTVIEIISLTDTQMEVGVRPPGKLAWRITARNPRTNTNAVGFYFENLIRAIIFSGIDPEEIDLDSEITTENYVSFWYFPVKYVEGSR